ncbi:sulfate adenylyltransferase subunit 2 [Persicimonas caeni]|uniref:Sulfate adenylyltransferase subunit 2 n=1 Tax=Persicimonas caeni TaxID=2292766 RepID=A0A4Y6Q2T1_PERCE|nr:sulfate adenylyltransferase subunit 2 [Persicimonas caeni]QED36106.1 sulfate adenylyltransferase subunit 2 [Persicimonas caeni]
MPDYSHLDELEAQSIFIIREAFNKFDNLGMLWSMGKDSSVLLWLARKAFFGHVPFPVMHVDTSYKIPEMIQFRDELADQWNLDLRVGQNKAEIEAGNTFPVGNATRVECCSMLKKDALQDLIAANDMHAIFLGIRRDEEGTRAKERYFSPRDKDFAWDFKDQPPELWDQFKTDFEPGTHLRIHPLLHWTEVNIWEYIDRERIPTLSLYFADSSDDGTMRYRSLGCAPCTDGIASTANTVPDIIAELKATKVSERSTRAQDQESEDAFELLRASGYM